MMKGKILLVEDESDLAMIVADTLRGQGYEVVTATDGLDGLERFCSEGADIIVADVMMPRMDGFEMGRRIRALSPGVPLIFLTAKSTIDDVELGFDIGANDYLKKPFELRELIIRVKALLRRVAASSATEGRVYQIGAYRFEPAAQRLVCGGRVIGLSNIEARLLEPLAARTGHSVDASELMMAVWQRDEISNRNSLHGYIHKLRHALRFDSTVAIINQRGFGYMLTVRR